MKPPTPTGSSPMRASLAFLTVISLTCAQGAVFFQEGFNDDGEAANPARYTTEGRDVYETGTIAGQEGPAYWAHNFEVSFVGVPAPTHARRAIFAWNNNMPADTVTDDLLQLFGSTMAWLANDMAGATICFSPGAAGTGDQVLVDYLETQGYTVIHDDDPALDIPVADAYVHTSTTATDPSRLTLLTKGVLTYNGPDHDDMLVSSIGAGAVVFAPSGASITPANHPAAGGKTGSFQVLSSGDGTFDLPGDILPLDSTVVAEFTRTIPPTAASLAEVDAMVAGTKESTQFTGTARDMDFDLNSPGDWSFASPIPGDPQDVFGVVVEGTLDVSVAGAYSLALGVDDGARLRIDIDQNGIDANDTIINEDAGGAHRAVYGDPTFPTSGDYAFEITWFNSGGGASLEFSAAIAPGAGERSAINSGAWEVLGAPVDLQGNISLPNDATVTTYVPGGPPVEETIPLLVVLEAPEEGGIVFGGGPFVGFEGTGFFAASAANKWAYPAPLTYRSLTLAPVDVSGRQDVKLTVALAATLIDFETSDFLDIMAYPNDLTSTPVRLARYSAPNDASKFFVDVDNGNANQLSLNFRDVTYDIPAGATQLVLEFRTETTWWNEIVAFDNVRLSEGSIAPPSLSVTANPAGDLMLTFDQGVLESATTVDGTYDPVPGSPQGTYTIDKANQTDPERYYRVRN